MWDGYVLCEELKGKRRFPSLAWLESFAGSGTAHVHALLALVLQQLSLDTRAGRAVIWRPAERRALGNDGSVERLGR